VGVKTAAEVAAEDAMVTVELEDMTTAGTMAADTAQAEAVMAVGDMTAVAEDAMEDVTESKDATEESV
jgi:hypothetical protein